MNKRQQAGKYIEGIFVRELKNRFLCEVVINGVVKECYVPSSCHLSNFLNLKGKKVLLVETQTKNSRTEHALFAVPFKKNFLMLNISLANRAIEKSLKSRKFAFLGDRKECYIEHKIEGYKADIYISNTNTIIEVKSVISTNNEAVFPTVYSERTQNQLEKLQKLLESGYKACFMIVSMNPYLKKVQIDKKTEFYRELIKCIEKGLSVKAYTCFLGENGIEIKKEITLDL